MSIISADDVCCWDDHFIM